MRLPEKLSNIFGRRGAGEAGELSAARRGAADHAGELAALARALAAAEVGHALLLFRDPAPAVVAHLARFAGLAIVETESPPDRAIGPALPVAFPRPDAAARTALWQRAIPATAPVGALDLASLAARFELSGGAIREAALRAAYAAARAGQPIGMAHLERAAGSMSSS